MQTVFGSLDDVFLVVECTCTCQTSLVVQISQTDCKACITKNILMDNLLTDIVANKTFTYSPSAKISQFSS